MRLVYLGTPPLAVPPLRALVDAGHDVGLVVTNADKRRGRGGALVPTPVKVAATELGLPVTQRVDDALALDPPAALGVVVAFGRLIKPHVLERIPMINVHFSRLPRWRGAAPVERAILAGDEETAVAVMGLEETLDTGPVYAEEIVAIGPDDTLEELRGRLVDVGTRLVLDVLERGIDNVPARAQEGETTYAHKIEPAELELHWERPAVELHRRVRVGGAWTTFRGHRLKVHRSAAGPDRGLAPGELAGVEVGTGGGTLVLVEVQPEGRPVQPATAWVNGARLVPGDRLGS